MSRSRITYRTLNTRVVVIQAVDYAHQPAIEGESDIALMDRLQQGQLSALGVLYDRHAGLVYSMALKVLHRVAEAEDLTQEVFLILVRTRSYDHRRGSLVSYLTTLTRSRAIDRLRSQSTQQKYLNQWQQTQPSLDATTPMKQMTQQEHRALVRKALSGLKDCQREVLELSYYEGQSQRDIAKQLDLPLGTVKSWARRGLLQLRKQLSDVLGEEAL